MNRSLTNVLFGGIAPAPTGGPERKVEGTITKTNVDEVVEALTGAESVIIAPGYVHPTLYVFDSTLTLSVQLWNGGSQGSVCDF